MDKNKQEELIPRWTKYIKEKKLERIKKKMRKMLRKNDNE